jgi:hypothetical protein
MIVQHETLDHNRLDGRSHLVLIAATPRLSSEAPPLVSKTILTARSPSSLGYLPPPRMAPSFCNSEPPSRPGRRNLGAREIWPSGSR